MREKHAADRVSNGVNGRLVGLIVVIGADPTAFDLDFGLVQAEVVGNGLAADRDEDDLALSLLFLLLVFHRQLHHAVVRPCLFW